MLYELKQKIRHSKYGEKFADWLEQTPFFPYCYWWFWILGLTEPKTFFCQSEKEVRKYFSANEEKVKKVLSLLEDKKSKDTFLKCIKYRVFSFYYMKGTPHDQYFPKDIIYLNDNEVFVDCGAFTGDTIAKFRERSHEHYKKIIAFEPDPSCRQQILEQKIDRCEVFPYGAWDKKETQVFYYDGKGTSAVGDIIKNKQGFPLKMTETTVLLNKIDDLEACAQVTFLKMDIEGAELNALKGAEQTIRHQRPKLAICIYHSCQDLLEIPLWVCLFKFRL